jgi:hypothetical protein
MFFHWIHLVMLSSLTVFLYSGTKFEDFSYKGDCLWYKFVSNESKQQWGYRMEIQAQFHADKETVSTKVANNFRRTVMETLVDLGENRTD